MTDRKKTRKPTPDDDTEIHASFPREWENAVRIHTQNVSVTVAREIPSVLLAVSFSPRKLLTAMQPGRSSDSLHTPPTPSRIPAGTSGLDLSESLSELTAAGLSGIRTRFPIIRKHRLAGAYKPDSPQSYKNLPNTQKKKRRETRGGIPASEIFQCLYLSILFDYYLPASFCLSSARAERSPRVVFSRGVLRAGASS